MQPPRKKVKRATEPVAVTHPHLMSEWDYEQNNKLEYDPYKLTHGSVKKVYWICQRVGHKWDAKIYCRSQGKGCPYCSNKKVCADNCLANNDPYNVCSEWDQGKNGSLTPYDVVPKSDKKVWWICKYNHSWQALIKSRSNGIGCPYCAGQKTCTDNCLVNNDPHNICQEWDYDKNGSLTPNDVTQSSRIKVWWKCKVNPNHSWKTNIYSRSYGSGCPYCSNKKACEDNCLFNNDVYNICSEWDQEKNGSLTPYDVVPFSRNKVWWKCKVNRSHSWQAQISDRSNGNGCPDCNNERKRK